MSAYGQNMPAKTMKHTIKSLISVCSTLVLAGLFLAANGWAQTAKTEGSTKAEGVTRINVSFKLDPRVSGPTYGGERWVSPPTYQGASAQDTVEARVEGTDARGRPVTISPKWTPADPEMVAVSPSTGNAVKITVKRTGESLLELSSGGVTKKLSIKAEKKNDVMLVQISQNP